MRENRLSPPIRTRLFGALIREAPPPPGHWRRAQRELNEHRSVHASNAEHFPPREGQGSDMRTSRIPGLNQWKSIVTHLSSSMTKNLMVHDQ